MLPREVVTLVPVIRVAETEVIVVGGVSESVPSPIFAVTLPEQRYHFQD